LSCKERVEGLLAKYRTLVRLRERRDAVQAAGGDWPAGELVFRKRAFRALAQAFPGALRELELPLEVLVQRAAEVEVALSGLEAGRPVGPAWIRVCGAFHARLGEALLAKGWLARQVGRRAAITTAHLAGLAELLGRPMALAEAEALHHPPGGRVVELVWRGLEQELEEEGLSAEALRALIFKA
jgi:hypothetical protein